MVREQAVRIKAMAGLQSYPVGVKFIFIDKNVDISTNKDVETLNGHRYCQALMKARGGKHVLLNKHGIACPAAAAAFGFKPLPDLLKSGKGLIGFGITKEENTGREMFNGMTTLEPEKLDSLYLFPMESANLEPDIVIIEDQVEKLMWIALAYLNAKGGKRIESSTAILQATCVDATTIPFLQNKMNLSFGCYGCRDATDIGVDEAVLGFPFADFMAVSEYIAFLETKGIPNSRSKKAYSNLESCSGMA